MSIDALKAHLNIDHDADDALLTAKLEAAQAFIDSYTGTSNTFLHNPVAGEAVLQLAAAWYEQREAVAFGNSYVVPFGVHEMLAPLRYWSAF